MDNRLDLLTYGEPLHVYIITIVVSEILIFHDLLSDARESRELCLEKWYCLGIELHHTILDCLEIASHSSDRCTYLMRYIREKIGPYFFLYAQ